MTSPPAFIRRFGPLDARIEREILRLRARYQLSLDEFRGLYVSDEQVDRLLADAGAQPDRLASATIERPAAGIAATDARWRQLVDAFGLSSLDEDLLLIAAAPEFDSKYETLYAYLNNDVTRKWPTADLARRLLADLFDVGALIGALAPGATLRATHLVEHVPAPSARPALLNAGYALHPCIAQWLHGHGPDLALTSNAIHWISSAQLPWYDDSARERSKPIVRLLAAARSGSAALPVIALLGQPGSGRTATAAAVAQATERSIARLDLRALPADPAELGAVLDQLGLALRLEPAVVLVEGFENVTVEEQRHSSALVRLQRALGEWPGSVLVLLRTNDEELWRSVVQFRRVLESRYEAHGSADGVALWRSAARLEDVNLPDDELPALAGRFALTPGQVRATLATARDLAAMGDTGELRPEQLAAAARLASDQALGRLATKVDRKHEWADLVLPVATLGRLHELAAAIRQRHLVYHAWGFAERVITGVGIKALFASACSGTGKTMAAGVIAHDLGLDLYRVDLSGVVSKYIGETEKNLDRIFRTARTANAIVFLDEAEAILGKRSEVKDAHDRYANIEVAYLLQKLEEHDGVVILATNLKGNIDEAFSRRMQYVIDFPRPSETERERIWRGMFPTRAPLEPEVDFRFLAKQFDLAGGDIRNVVLDAAFLAAKDGGVIGMRVIVEALSRQLAKQGKTPTGADFRQYQPLLLTGAGRHDGR